MAPEAPESPQQRLQPPHAGLRAPLLVVGRWKHVDGESTNSSTLNRGVIIQTLNSWTRVITIMNINYWNHIESMAVVVGTQQIFSQNILSLFDFLNLRPVYVLIIYRYVGRERERCVYVYIYIHIYSHTHIYIHRWRSKTSNLFLGWPSVRLEIRGCHGREISHGCGKWPM